jgi:hypothetical protein
VTVPVYQAELSKVRYALKKIQEWKMQTFGYMIAATEKMQAARLVQLKQVVLSFFSLFFIPFLS